MSGLSTEAEAWFAARGWVPHDFQRQVWQALAAGRSGLLHATTGSGKTYAVGLGAMARRRPGAGLQVLWITPMRALAADTVRALQVPLPDLAPGWTVGLRTGDTASAERARQDRALPPVLTSCATPPPPEPPKPAPVVVPPPPEPPKKPLPPVAA